MEVVQSVSFAEAIKLFFVRYTDFNGRSRRSEYWWFTLFNIIVSAIIAMALPDIAGLWSLIVLIPSLSLCIRRLHDVGKSGWWYLILFVPLVGEILLLVWFCRDSGPDNRWGPNPKVQPGNRLPGDFDSNFNY